jgi:hypothetical protein
MKCPSCNKDIDDGYIGAYLGAKGGKSRKTKYRPSPDKARAMATASHEARRRNTAGLGK